jgi:hypothetical protein
MTILTPDRKRGGTHGYAGMKIQLESCWSGLPTVGIDPDQPVGRCPKAVVDRPNGY